MEIIHINFIFKQNIKKIYQKSILINVNDNKFDFNNSDKFGNNLIERFTIINIPEQDVNKLLKLSNKNIHEIINTKAYMIGNI